MPDLDRFAVVIGRTGAAACDAIVESLRGECSPEHAQAMIAEALDEMWRHLRGIPGAKEALGILKTYCTVEARQGDMFAPPHERAMDRLAQVVGHGTQADLRFLRVAQQCLQQQVWDPQEVFQRFGEAACRAHFSEARDGLLQRMSAGSYAAVREDIAGLYRPVASILAERLADSHGRVSLDLSREFRSPNPLTATDLVPM